MAHQPIPESWSEAVNQEHHPIYADFVNTQEPKPIKSVPQISNSIPAKAKLVSSSTPANVHFESHPH